MTELPTGTVTLLFSDIEGSTVLLSRLGADYAQALTGQRQVLRRAWTGHDGTEMGTEGDSFYVAFSTAHDAVSAAVQAQRELEDYLWPHGERVRVRMGIHTGEPIRHDGAYVGMDVVRAARIAATAHGGQVVLTDATCHLLGGGPPQGARLSDLGWHRLKDLPAPEHLFQVHAEGLDDSFPPLRSLGTTTSLPAQSTPLVGREVELDNLEGLLRTPGVRLLTLTGPGGSGKTRLAMALAADSAGSFPDGVFFVPLAAVTNPESMWTALAEALSMAGQSGTRQRLLELVSQRLLLVLDNLEQLTGADLVVSELLDSAPELMIIATSRRPLHLRGEHEHAVPPLDLPQQLDVSDAASSGAVQLFCQHAAMVRSGFRLTADNAGDVAAICARLDGLPLAIELAAARSKLLSPAALLARLGSTLELRGIGVDRPTRQQTLRDTIAWSYDLLRPDGQAFFRSLGIFAGSGDLAAVEAVAHVNSDPIDLVADLVDVSLANITDGPDGEPRVGLLQTVADFAVDRLRAEDELDATRRRHAEHFLALAESLTPQLHTARQVVVRGRLEVEHDNIRGALNWALQPGSERPRPDQAVIGLRLCVAMWWYWASHGHMLEGGRWLQRAVEVTDGAVSSERAGALHALTILRQGVRDELPAARERLEESLAMFRRLGDLSGVSDVANTLGQTLEELDEPAVARDLYQQSIHWARQAGDELRLASAMHSFAFLEEEQSDAAAAIALIEEARDIARRWGNERDIIARNRSLADVLIRTGDVQRARALLLETVPDALRIREPTVSIQVVGTAADLFVELGDFERAATFGATYEHLGVTVGWPVEAVEGRGRGGGARQMMGRDAWDRAVRDGRGLTAEEALKDAQSALVAAADPGNS